MDLIDKLKKLQGDKSQQEFASDLGIDQSVLSRLYSGEIGVGKKTAKAICEKHPELREDVAAFLLGADMQVHIGRGGMATRPASDPIVIQMIEQIQPGELGCLNCGYVADASKFGYGYGRQYGQHPSHRYCARCGQSITWHGCLDGNRVALHQKRIRCANGSEATLGEPAKAKE